MEIAHTADLPARGWRETSAATAPDRAGDDGERMMLSTMLGIRFRCRGSAAFLALLVGLLLVSVAGATPRLLVPPDGAVMDSYPLFFWELERGDVTEAIYVARRPETTPEGAFHSQNVAASHTFTDGRLQTWTPRTALFAGRYWWNLRTHNIDLVSVYSRASSFLVHPSIRILLVRTRRLFARGNLEVDVRWATNVRRVLVEARLFGGRRVVGRVGESEQTRVALVPDREVLEWRRPRSVSARSRLRLVVRVSGMNWYATVAEHIEAP
jgi:hypothetical protein